jgi:serine/threonine-protein kinase
MAQVYLAMSRSKTGVNKLVVLKALRAGLSDDPEFLRMFWNEARLSARLSHPNVVHVYEVIEDRGSPVLVMEYLEGVSLSQLQERSRTRGPLPVGFVLRVIADTLAGLHYAHELCDYDGTPLGVCHRDVSPQNVQITFDGQIKVLDFGIARGRGISSETRSGVIKGKVRYMAPEQMSGSIVDRRADIYGVGMVMWELLTGQTPWPGCSDVVIIQRAHTEPLPSPSAARPDLPASLDRLVARAMSHDPANRFPDCLEFQQAVERLADELGERVAARDAGSFAAALFADVVSARRLQIQRLLVDVGASVNEPAVDVVPRSMELPSLALAPLTMTRTRAMRAGQAPLRRALASPARVAAGAASAIALAAALFTVQWRSASSVPVAALSAQERPNHVQVEAAPAPPTEAPLASSHALLEARIVVRPTPRDALVYLDDVLLSGDPPSRSARDDGQEHTLRVEAAGHRTRTSRLALDGPMDLSIALEPAAPAPRAKPAAKVAAASSPVASIAPPKPVALAATGAAAPKRDLDRASPWP